MIDREELKELIKEVLQEISFQYNHIDENDSLEYDWRLLKELVLNTNDVYPLDEKECNRTTKGFRDNLGRLNLIRAKTNLNSIEIKFYWLKEVNGELIPSYDDPPNSTNKTFNTYLKIFFDYFIYLGDSFVFLPTDLTRYRLYRIALNKMLDKNKWKIFEREDILTLFISKK